MKEEIRWYNNPLGIEASIQSLDGMRLLRSARMSAYSRHEPLDMFYILGGRFCLDRCGYLDMFVGEDPFLINPSLLPVMNEIQWQENWVRFVENNGNRPLIGYSSFWLPHDILCCPQCGEGWEVENVHDVLSRTEMVDIPLTNFVGKTLKDVRKHYRKKPDGIFFLRPKDCIKNVSSVSLEPLYSNPENSWEEKQQVNPHGFVELDKTLPDTYIVKAGDVGHFDKKIMYHNSCYRKYMRGVVHTTFHRMFEAVGFQFGMEAIPNGYDRSRADPWFQVQTEVGLFVIGWRRHVIEIRSEEVDFLAVLPEEQVTRSKHLTHAWGVDKAEEYLKIIRAKLSLKK